MDNEDHPAPHSNTAALRNLRAKIRKPQTLSYISATQTKKKKPEPPMNKMMKASLKKKKKNLIKKISNQIDFNSYKKLFASTFSKFEPSNNVNSSKSNFHNFYTHVKSTTEGKAGLAVMNEENNNDMVNFLKNKKESVNLKTLEKAQKVFESTVDLMEKDMNFLDNFDVAKISNNVDDMKIKLDQCRKIIQKYNLNKEIYNNNTQKDEGMDQLVFSKRLKIYETLKQEADCSFDDVLYDVEFLPKETLGPLRPNSNAAKRVENTDLKDSVLASTKNFSDTVDNLLTGSNQLEESFVNTIKGSQLDYILKFNNKEEDPDIFQKNLKSMVGNVSLDGIDLKSKEESGLGWKIFNNLIYQNLDGSGVTTRKGLDIIGTKHERFRTQKKNSDFLYYEHSSVKKNTSHEPESKRTPRDKHSSHKKKSIDHPVKATSRATHHTIFLPTEKSSAPADDKSDSETQMPLPQKRLKVEQEDLKTMKMAESLIDDYREVLHHAFRNLSSQDPYFVRQAIMQDRELEKKTGIQLLDLPRPQGRDGLFQLGYKDIHTDNYSLNIPAPSQPDWSNQSKPIYAIPSPYNGHSVPGYISTMASSLPTPNPMTGGFLAIPMIINASPTLMAPVQLKPLDGISPIPGLIPNSFQPVLMKSKLTDSPTIPDLKTSPHMRAGKVNDGILSHFNLDASPHKMNNMRLPGEQVVQKMSTLEPIFHLGNDDARSAPHEMSNGTMSRKNSMLDHTSNTDELPNGNYNTILNTLDKLMPLNGDNGGDKAIKKNIILTRNAFTNA